MEKNFDTDSKDSFDLNKPLKKVKPNQDAHQNSDQELDIQSDER